MMSSRYRFGLFEFDVDQQALSRQGRPLHLQSQPARVLACLLQHRDRVVSRDELRQTVWGDTTYVEFDGSLNFCIAQIRSALGDNSSSPIYIRTVPKSGYQFIAPIEVVGAGPGTEDTQPKRPDRPRRMLATALAAAALSVLAFIAGYQLRSRQKSRVLPIVAVARFDNETGNPDLTRFSDSLTDNLVERLTAAGDGRYAVIGNAQILRVPREQRDLTAFASTLKAKYVVLGQVQPDGDQTRILAHLIRLPEQTHIWVARIEQTGVAPGTVEAQLAERIAAAFSTRVASDISSGFSSRGLGR
jgi:DNA-binding winged helix-turn-helix (wHTH) protein/TolB-like protein